MTDRPPIEQRVVWTRGLRYADHTVLRALARWWAYRPDGTGVCPPSVDAIARKVMESGLSYRTVERALARLVRNRYLWVTDFGNRRPTMYALNLERLATADPDSLRAVSRPESRRFDRHNGGRDPTSTAIMADETAFDRQSGGRNGTGPHENGPDSEKVADESAAAADLCTSTRTSSAAEEGTGTTTKSAATLADEAVATVRGWWASHYPRHNAGAQYVVDRQDSALIADLLRILPVERVQAMALALWAIETDGQVGSHRWWIAERSDRSIRVLHRKANFLQRIVLGAEPQQLTLGPDQSARLTAREIADAEMILTRVGYCRHEPGCEERAECVRKIALARKVG